MGGVYPPDVSVTVRTVVFGRVLCLHQHQRCGHCCCAGRKEASWTSRCRYRVIVVMTDEYDGGCRSGDNLTTTIVDAVVVGRCEVCNRNWRGISLLIVTLTEGTSVMSLTRCHHPTLFRVRCVVWRCVHK